MQVEDPQGEYVFKIYENKNKLVTTKFPCFKHKVAILVLSQNLI